MRRRQRFAWYEQQLEAAKKERDEKVEAKDAKLTKDDSDLYRVCPLCDKKMKYHGFGIHYKNCKRKKGIVE